jgi:excisionase family DNA binding protein
MVSDQTRRLLMGKDPTRPDGAEKQGPCWTVKQTADYLGMRDSGIRHWLAIRKLPFYKLGRQIRIPRAAVEELLSRNLIPARPEHWR